VYTIYPVKGNNPLQNITLRENVPVTPTPGAPANVTATAASATSITVSWSSVAGATWYYVYRGSSATGTYSKAGDGTSSTTYTNIELSEGTTYYYKVSAYNSAGESALSSYVSATTNYVGTPPVGNSDTGSFTDSRGSGRVYKKVKIGGKWWMGENLNYDTAYRVGSWCYNDSCNKYAVSAKYGRLYNWATAKTVCPTGWHLPTRAEWGELAVAVGGTGTYGTGGTAGTKLKSTTGWTYYNDSYVGTDDFGFSALPGGSRVPAGGFRQVGEGGNWWTTTESGGSGIAYFRRMVCYDDNVSESLDDRNSGYSVRCVMDD